jgi:hypothetical protein
MWHDPSGCHVGLGLCIETSFSRHVRRHMRVGGEHLCSG